jgi:hypothetical protein
VQAIDQCDFVVQFVFQPIAAADRKDEAPAAEGEAGADAAAETTETTTETPAE